MQKIITLLIAISILYMIFQQNMEQIKSPSNIDVNDKKEKTQNNSESKPQIKPSGNFFEKTVSNVVHNVLKTEEGRMFLESMLQPISTNNLDSKNGFKVNNSSLIHSLFQVNTFGKGDGNPVSCGHIVNIRYKKLTLNNVLIEEKTLSIPLGSGKLGRAAEAIIIGMKPGQTRHATVTNNYMEKTNDKKSKPYKLNIVLNSATPSNFVSDNEIKIFDDEFSYQFPILCGSKAIYDARITRLSNGEVIYDSVKNGKKINMVVGNLNYPIIFSYALHNKVPIGTRTAIARGELFKSYASEYSVILKNKKLPMNEYFMVEFFNFY